MSWGDNEAGRMGIAEEKITLQREYMDGPKSNRQPGLGMVMQDLEREISVLEETLNRLIGAIKPVLLPSVPPSNGDKEGKPERQAICEVAAAYKNQVNRIYTLRKTMEDLIECIDI